MPNNSEQFIPIGTDSYNLPIETEVKGKRVLYDMVYKPNFDVVLAYYDITEFLETVPNETFMLSVTSPPYNLGKPYEEQVAFDEYLNWQADVIKLMVKKMKPNGSICWEVGNYVKDGEVFPLDIYFHPIFSKLGLKLRNRIIWHFGHGLHARTRFSGRYETIMWYTLGDDYVFNLDPVRVPQMYPGKRAYKGPNKGEYSGNPKGKNPSDIWEVIVMDWERELWDIPNVKSNHPEKTIHTSQYPIELVERLVLALTNEGDVVFDPYTGVGTSNIAAVLHNRIGVGVDKEKAYLDIAYDRVIAALNGTLMRRPLGKPVYKPPKSLTLAQRPTEWEDPRE